MRVVLLCHSLLSDWNHGNAHFLRGVMSELAARGHTIRVFEPRDAWSVENLVADHGEAPLAAFRAAYPMIDPVRYDRDHLDVARALDGADLVLVHEWNDPELVRRIGEHRASGGRYRLFFHDTHHRLVTDPEAIARFDLSGYDGVLAFGRALRDLYLSRGLTGRAFIWHEAADARVFYPRPPRPRWDVVFIGNYGDGERAAELEEHFIGPVRDLRLSAAVFGVRWPAEARAALARAGIAYEGWSSNFRVPEIYARARLAVHVPRRPYAATLPGVPTIRPFEALACAMPLVSAPWEDREGLFTPRSDYVIAPDGAATRRALCALLDDPAAAAALASHGRATILARHTCAHRVDELLAIAKGLDA
jgi:spore maturation protein CgeB